MKQARAFSFALRKFLSVGFLAILLLSVMLAFIAPVYATNPTVQTMFNAKTATTLGGATTWTTSSWGSPAVNFIAGSTLIMLVSCVYTSSAPLVSSITDSIAAGSLTWVKDTASVPSSFYSGDATNPANGLATQEIWSAQVLTVPADTTYTTTFTFVNAATGCYAALDLIPQALMIPATPAYTNGAAVFKGASAPSEQITTGTSNLQAGTLAIYFTLMTESWSSGSAFPQVTSVSDNLGTALTGPIGGHGTWCVEASGACNTSAGVATIQDDVFFHYYTSAGNIFFIGTTGAAAGTLYNPTYNSLVAFLMSGSQQQSTPQTQTNGSPGCTDFLTTCLTPGSGVFTGHSSGSFTMANNTIYLYSANALQQTVVNTIGVAVNSTIGSGSHTLQLLVYISGGQAVSAQFPFTLAYSHSFVLTSGTTNDLINDKVAIQLTAAGAALLPIEPANIWAVGVVGDNKIKLATSNLAGLTTETGNPSTAAQPSTFTGIGTSVTTKLYLWATSSYQSVVTINSVTTSTTTQSATTTVSTTSTSTVTTIGAALFSTSSNWPVIFLILVLPAGLFLGVTKTLAGALLGLGIGAVIGILMGILPSWIFVGLVISLVSIAFIARERET